MMQEAGSEKTPDYILYCGSFDPPHKGHSDCIRHAAMLFPAAEIIVLPSPQPVQAGGVVKATQCDMDTRGKMCELAFIVDEGFKKVRVSDLEARLSAPHYTLNLLKWFGENVSCGKNLALLIGLDQLGSFAKWHEPQEVLARSDVIVVKRDHESILPVLTRVMGAELGLALRWVQEEKIAEIVSLKRRIYILDLKTTEVSSSQIRADLKSGKKVHSGWLTPSVEGFIQEGNWYR
jgi:nicotinate (nicotinamide) nucleotide adenylyltransferase